LRTLLIFVLAVSAGAHPARALSDGVGLDGPAVEASDFGGGGMESRDQPPVLKRYFETGRSNVLRGATMVAKFAGKVPKLGREATLQAKRVILADGVVEYDVIERNGDRTVQKDLIARYMGAEIESSAHPSEDLAINELNYKFKVKGLQAREGQQVQVLEVNPRKKRPGLFKGEIWLDPDSGLTLCETGRFVKSPSVFLKKVEFSRKYKIVDGRSVPANMQTQIQTRFWGMAELQVEYSEIKIGEQEKPATVGQTKLDAPKPQEDRQYLAQE
jgi:hypothetical protein